MNSIRKQSVINLLKKSWMVFAVLIIIAAIMSSLFRALTPWATQYKKQVEYHLSVFFGERVHVGSMETGWYWFDPVIKLKEVSVSGAHGKAISIKKLLVGINLFKSVLSWRMQPGVLYIDGISLAIRQNRDRWQIDGLDKLGKSQTSWGDLSSQPVLALVLAQQKIIIKNLSATVILLDKTVIPVQKLKLTVVKRAGRYQIRGETFLQQSLRTSFQLLADIELNPYALKKSAGQVYFSAQNLLFSQWQPFFPNTRLRVNDGEGDLQLWLDWKAGAAKNVQARVSIYRLGWQDTLSQKKNSLRYVNANLAWNSSKTGWQLSADHINLGFGSIIWPENSLQISHQTDRQTYSIYVQHLFPESVIALLPDIPEKFERIVSMKPHGILEDTQCQFKDGTLIYFLTKFSALGWNGLDAVPGVKNMAGVLHWQPEEGILELDSDGIVIKPQGKPAISFKSLNAAFNWKELSHGLRVSMERFVVRHPDLLASAEGYVDNVLADKPGQISLKVQVSAKNVQRWFPWLPANYLKPKLEAWLKHDIRQIKTLVAEVSVNGQASDFPFDRQPGEFLIKGYVRGVDLFFGKDWPLTRDLESAVTVDKRTLEFNVEHASLDGIPIHNGNIMIHDIGYDHESLLVHTTIDARAKKALAYIAASPLGKKLKALEMINMQGRFNLDLHLQAPLYPESDKVLAEGSIIFKNNALSFNHFINKLRLDSLNGTLQFDQEGVLDSRLQASIMDYPVDVIIEAVRNQHPYANVTLKGKTSVAVLQNTFDWPISSLMHGDFWLESLLKISNNPRDLNHLQIRTSLLGVAVTLPKPFGKSETMSTPLTVDIDFNSEKAIHIALNYNENILGNLWFTSAKGQVKLERGGIRLGSVGNVPNSKTGLKLTGVLPEFDAQQWKSALAAIPPSTIDFRDFVELVNITFETADFGRWHYPNLTFKAEKSSRNEWAIGIHQQDIAGKFRYRFGENSLNGSFSQLRFKKSDLVQKSPDKSGRPFFHVRNIPNLLLQIKSLEYANVNLGEVNLKTTTRKGGIQLDYCHLAAPSYLIMANGMWSVENRKNYSTVKATMQINDLANTLIRWNISPVVEAHKGSVQFQGNWPGAWYDFSLAKVSGQLSMVFENGRITHLSPETESKLGLGKLLSILSLQTLPRRLKLDFSDLAHDGFSFDEFRGNFTMAKGLMNTQDTFINGPIAYASMKGSLDIARQLYDLDLHVSPHVTASLPIVATIAGGPVAGLATWVVSKIINKGMQGISGYTYKISGPWKQPVVQQVSIIKKK